MREFTLCPTEYPTTPTCCWMRRPCCLIRWDKAVSETFFENVEAVLGERKLDYIVVHHMEPDHSPLWTALCAVIRTLRSSAMQDCSHDEAVL